MTKFMAAVLVAGSIFAACVPAGGVEGGKMDNKVTRDSGQVAVKKDKAVVKLRLVVGGHVLTAVLDEGKTARDFVKLLPLSMKMGDLFRREKYAHLPRPLIEDGAESVYEAGDISYWPPGGDIAIFYRQDGQKVPGGIIRLARITSGLEALDVPGPLTVRIELLPEVK